MNSLQVEHLFNMAMFAIRNALQQTKATGGGLQPPSTSDLVARIEKRKAREAEIQAEIDRINQEADAIARACAAGAAAQENIEDPGDWRPEPAPRAAVPDVEDFEPPLVKAARYGTYPAHPDAFTAYLADPTHPQEFLGAKRAIAATKEAGKTVIGGAKNAVDYLSRTCGRGLTSRELAERIDNVERNRSWNPFTLSRQVLLRKELEWRQDARNKGEQQACYMASGLDSQFALLEYAMEHPVNLGVQGAPIHLASEFMAVVLHKIGDPSVLSRTGLSSTLQRLASQYTYSVPTTDAQGNVKNVSHKLDMYIATQFILELGRDVPLGMHFRR